MSVSKWRYTEECNGRPCPGDCDYCSFEPTDLISRADAIEAVKDTILKRFNLADWYEEMLNCGVEIEDRINALPSADAVQGEWIDYVGKDLGIEGQWLRDDGKTVFVQCDQ